MGYSNRPCARGCPPGGGGGGVQIECLDVIQISFIHQYLLYLGRPRAFGFGLSDSLSVCGCRNVMWHKMEEMGRGMVGVWYTHFTSIIGVDIITPLLYDRKHLCGPARVQTNLKIKVQHISEGLSDPGEGCWRFITTANCSPILIPRRNTSIVTCLKLAIPPFRIYMNGCQPDGEKYGTSPSRWSPSYPPLRKWVEIVTIIYSTYCNIEQLLTRKSWERG